MKNFKYSLFILFILLFTGCNEKQTNDQKIFKPFLNKSITVIVPKLGGDQISGPILTEAKNFEKLTGATVRVVTPSWADTIKKTKLSLSDEKLNYDIFVIISSWGGSLFSDKHIAPIPKWVKEKIDWDDVLPIYKNSVLSWGGVQYGLPYDGDCISLYYRKDLFNDKKHQEKFLKEFGYSLDVPKTWDQYRDIAKYFSGWDWDNDHELEYGIAGSRLKGYGTMLQFFSRAAAYVKYPDDKAYYFDPDTMKPRINNLGFVKALEDYIDIIKYAPPQIYKFTPGSVRKSFIGGEVAMAIDWANMGTMSANSEMSVVKGKVGYAQLPGYDKVYNSKTKKWEDRYNNPSSVSGNWTILVNKNSKNKDLAFEFASFMTSKEMTNKLTAIGSSGVNPSRYSHFNNQKEWIKAGFSEDEAKEYLETLSMALNNKNVIADIRIPGADKYYSVLGDCIDLAIKGKLSPKEALDKVYDEWEKITNSLDREKQKIYYKESINE